MGQSPQSRSTPQHSKSIIIELPGKSLTVEISDENLTTGWLLSEAIRHCSGSKVLVALCTARGCEMLDCWLLHFERSLSVFPDKERLMGIFEEIQPLSVSSFKPVKTIGKGAYSKVILTRKRDTGELFATKIISKQFVIQANKVPQMLNEKNILASTDCPFVVKLHWAFQTKKDLHLVLDFCPGGELFFHLQSVGKLTEEAARFYFCEIVLALEYLHKEKRLVYRDLKPENVLLDIDGHIRVTDFGLSKELENARGLTYSFCGSPEYMCPEMLNAEGHGQNLDLYTLGALLYEMLTGLPPFYHPQKEAMYQKVLKEELKLPSYLSRTVKHLLRSLLQKEPALRLGAFEGIVEVKRHQWLVGVNWEKLYRKMVVPPYLPSVNISNFDTMFTTIPVKESDFSAANEYIPTEEDPFYGFDKLPEKQGSETRMNTKQRDADKRKLTMAVRKKTKTESADFFKCNTPVQSSRIVQFPGVGSMKKKSSLKLSIMCAPNVMKKNKQYMDQGKTYNVNDSFDCNTERSEAPPELSHL